MNLANEFEIITSPMVNQVVFVLFETNKKKTVIKHQPDIYIQVQMRRDCVVQHSRSYQIEQHHKLNAQTCSTKKTAICL